MDVRHERAKSNLPTLATSNRCGCSLRRLKRHPAFQAWKPPFDLVKDSLPFGLRMATNRFRHLPTTVIVGAQKAGTTQLYAYMVKHPRCYGAAEKEVDYFSKHPERPCRLVSVAVSAGDDECVRRQRARARGVAFVFADAECAAEDAEGVAERASDRAVARSGVAGVFALSAREDAALGVAEFCGGRGGQRFATNAFPAKCGVALARRCQADAGLCVARLLCIAVGTAHESVSAQPSACHR